MVQNCPDVFADATFFSSRTRTVDPNALELANIIDMPTKNNPTKFHFNSLFRCRDIALPLLRIEK